MPRNETVGPVLMNPVEPKSSELLSNRAENAFRKLKTDHPEEKLLKNFMGILNRISQGNYGNQLDQLRSEITSAHLDKVDDWLREVVNTVFSAALNQPSFSPLYAKVCSELFPKDSDESSFRRFRRILLQQCERRFDNGLAHFPVNVSAISDVTERSKIEEAEQRFKRQTLANVRFVGELFKLSLLSDKTIHTEVGRVLFQSNHFPNPLRLESVIVLLDTIGDRIEKATEQAHTDRIFAELQRLVSVHPDMRIRSLLADLVGRRASDWNDNKKVVNPIAVERPAEVKKSLPVVPTSNVQQASISVAATEPFQSLSAPFTERNKKAEHHCADPLTANAKVGTRTRTRTLPTLPDKQEDAKEDAVCEAGTSTSNNNATASTNATASPADQISGPSADPIPRTDVMVVNVIEQPPPLEQTPTNPQNHGLNPHAAPFYGAAAAVPATPTRDQIMAKIKETDIPQFFHRVTDHHLLCQIIRLNGLVFVTHPDHPDFVLVYTKPGKSEAHAKSWISVRLGEVDVEVPSNTMMHTLCTNGSEQQQGEYAVEFTSKQQEKEFFSLSMAAVMNPQVDLVTFALWVVLMRSFWWRPHEWKNVKAWYDNDNVLSNKICEVICKKPKRDPGYQPNPPKRRRLRTIVEKCNQHLAQYGLFVVRVLERRGMPDQ